MTDTLKADSSASAFRKAVITVWMRHPWRSNVTVKRYALDADGIETKISNGTLDTYKYVIRVYMLVSWPTQKMIIVAPISTRSYITTELLTQESSPPLGGKFDIVCVNDVGQESIAEGISVSSKDSYISDKIQRHCDGMYNRVEVLPCS